MDVFWPKTAKILHFLKFWPNIVWKLFYILFLYEICLVDYFNNILIGQDAPCDKVLPLSGVMLCKNSTFISHFKLSMTGNLFLCNFLYVNMFRRSIFQPLHMFLWPIWPVSSPFRGSCCVKMAKNDWISTCFARFKLSLTGNLYLCHFFIRKIFNQSIAQPFIVC